MKAIKKIKKRLEDRVAGYEALKSAKTRKKVNEGTYTKPGSMKKKGGL
jgi:hypothetical protein